MKKATHYIDLNCDVGEGVGNEAGLFPFISSCNIACGGHAGDGATMEATLGLAMEHRVHIGAHPSYPDREHFGRRSLDLPLNTLQESLQNQMEALERAMEPVGATLHHIKAHGALYNDLARGGDLAEAYLEVLQPYRGRVLLFAPCRSAFASLAGLRGFQVWEEAFADRAYAPDGSLAPRKTPGALLTDPGRVFAQLRDMVVRGQVRCTDGSVWALRADTYCLHGDTPNAVEILAYLSRALPGESIILKK